MTKQSDAELASIMADVENERIDKSSWSPRRDEVIPKARTDRGDIEERNNRYFCSTMFAFDDLAKKPESKPILSSSDLAAGEFFVALSALADRRTRTGYAKLNELLAEISGATEIISDYCPITMRLDVFRNMERWMYARCERLCLQPLKTNDWAWIIDRQEETKAAFNALQKAIEIAVDMSKKRSENKDNCVGHSAPRIYQPV